MESHFPERLFGMRVREFDDPAEEMLPRFLSEQFDVKLMELDSFQAVRFHALVARERPGLRTLRSAISALGRIDDLPCLLFWPWLSFGQKESLAREGISYVQDARNAYIPFIGAVASSAREYAEPSTLSLPAQRIFLNYLAGRWVNCSAGDLAELVGKSRSSVTKYLAEITAIRPGLVAEEGKSRFLRPLKEPREALLDAFEPYLASPVVKVHRLKEAIPASVLAEAGAKVAGLSELSMLSNLSRDESVLEVAVDSDGLCRLKGLFGGELPYADWFEDAATVVHEWGYPLDGSLPASGAFGIDGLPPEHLYVSLVNAGYDDVRVTDAIEQLRRAICR